MKIPRTPILTVMAAIVLAGAPRIWAQQASPDSGSMGGMGRMMGGGMVLMAAGGISFGGVVSFLFADLIVLPILNIYRKYYGLKMSAFILATFYSAMVLSALAVEFGFAALGLVPEHREAHVVEASIRFNYTTVLNIIFVCLGALLLVRFFRTGGPEMLRMMERPAHPHPAAS